MSEKKFFSKDIKRALLSKDLTKAGMQLKKIKELSETTKKVLTGFVTFRGGILNKKVVDTVCDILSFDGTTEELDKKIETLGKLIGNETYAQDMILATLLVKLDILDRANSEEKYYKLIENTTKSTKSYLQKRVYDEQKENAWKNMQNTEISPLSGQYIDAAFRGELNPSLDFAKVITDVHMEKNNGEFPKLETFGSTACLLTRFGNSDDMELLKKATNFESLYKFSSNTSRLNEINENTTINDDILAKKIGISGGLARGNLNQLSELIRSFIISNFSIEVDHTNGLYKDTEVFNNFFFDTIDMFNNELVKNKNNKEVIKEVNYMLNCPVHIIDNKVTTIADCINYIVAFEDKNLINEDRKEILKTFMELNSIEPNKSLSDKGISLNLNASNSISGLKLMNCDEFTKEHNEQSLINTEVFKDLHLRTENLSKDDAIGDNEKTLTKEDKRKISCDLYGFLDSLIEERKSDKILLVLQHYKKVFGDDVRPMLKDFERKKNLGDDKKQFLAGVRENYINSKKSFCDKQEERKSSKNMGIGGIV